MALPDLLRPRAPALSSVGLALASAALFGLSGPFAKALLDAGWSPLSVVMARITGAASILVAALLLVERGRLRAHLRAMLSDRSTILLFGIAAIAGVQLCFFSAVQYLPVSVALLIEFLAPVVVLAWAWLVRGSRPDRATLLGAAVAVAGLVLVVGPGSPTGLHPAGVAWAVAAMACVACYFLIVDRAAPRTSPIVLVTAAMVVAVVALALVAPLPLLPVDVVLSGSVGFGSMDAAEAPWWVAVLVLAGASGALAYAVGVVAIARLGAPRAAMVGLSEVVFAAALAWIMLGEAMSGAQFAGAVAILAGLVLVERGRSKIAAQPVEPVPAPRLEEQ
ncbi:EamA family transporter [Lolliginicoccus levis]|uniref:EamA family transporter n=1 Tax=Lolliginicoccus levis TaxID=2919542 RepID=UPI00241C47D2|nr:DMT family transporter [Lolliginicoccus levis]